MISRRRAPVIGGLLGLTLPIGLAILVAWLRLAYVPSLVVTAAAFLVAGMYTRRRGPHQRGRTTLVLVIPTIIIFGLFAINAQNLALLAIPAVAVVASLAGEGIARQIAAKG